MLRARLIDAVGFPVNEGRLFELKERSFRPGVSFRGRVFLKKAVKGQGVCDFQEISAHEIRLEDTPLGGFRTQPLKAVCLFGCGRVAPADSIPDIELLKTDSEIAKAGVGWACGKCEASQRFDEEGP